MRCRLTNDGHVEVRVDGPYGEDFELPKWGTYEVLVIFAGGIGVRVRLACPITHAVHLFFHVLSMLSNTLQTPDPRPSTSLLPA